MDPLNSAGKKRVVLQCLLGNAVVGIRVRQDIVRDLRSIMEYRESRAKHSISKPAVTGQEDLAAAEQADETGENTADVRSVLPKKARDYLKRAERFIRSKYA